MSDMTRREMLAAATGLTLAAGLPIMPVLPAPCVVCQEPDWKPNSRSGSPTTTTCPPICLNGCTWKWVPDLDMWVLVEVKHA